MKIPGLLVLFFAIAFSSPAQTAEQAAIIRKIQSFPTYEAVVAYFFGLYDFESTTENQLRFFWTPDGWHVARKDEYKKIILDDQLLWNSNQHAYLPLRDYTERSSLSSSVGAPTDFLAKADTFNFNRIAYYDYDGWEYDMIKDLGGIEILPDTFLYGLAKAYYELASAHMFRQQGFVAFPDSVFNKMSVDERYAQYQKNIELEIATWQRLDKVNPVFQTIVGTPKLKLASSIMDYYFKLSYGGREHIADKYFSKPIYDDFMIGFAKNMLSACDKNAILFTNGDNDTYPLWYVQYQLKFRTDVTVVNLSLLNLGQYVEYAKAKVNAVQPLRSSFVKGQFDDQRGLCSIQGQQFDIGRYGSQPAIEFLGLR